MSLDKKDRKDYMNFPNTTSTFKNLIYKYQKKKKEDIEKSDKKFLLKNIQRKIQEVENEQQENDYIIAEVRKNAQIDKEILYSYGTKALNHIDEIRKLNITTKMDKSKFYEIYNDNNLNESIPLKSERNKTINTKHMRDKIINLPLIGKSRKINFSDNKSIYNNYSSLTIRKSSNSVSKTDTNSNFKNSNYSIDSEHKNNNFNYAINNLNLENKKDNNKNLSLFYPKTPLKTLNNDRESFMELKNKKVINTFRKKNPIIDSDYIKYIQEIKVKYLKEEKRQERYFENNNYGYDAYKLKYNYLKKKYFN